MFFLIEFIVFLAGCYFAYLLVRKLWRKSEVEFKKEVIEETEGLHKSIQGVDIESYKKHSQEVDNFIKEGKE